MPKRRRVELRLRLEEAQTAANAIEETLHVISLMTDDAPADTARLRRVLVKLRQGIEYVTTINPTRAT